MNRLIIFCFLISLPALAQKPRHYQSSALWTEMLVNQKINDRWGAQLDAQYRRRSHWWHEADGKWNLVDLPFQLVFRPWIRYQFHPQWNLGFSPVGYWRNFNWREDAGIVISHELRSSLQAQATFRPGKWRLQQRYRLEMRFRTDDAKNMNTTFSIADADFPLSPGLGRFRWQSRAQYALNDAVYLAASTEWFVNFGSSVKEGNTLDQSRNSLCAGFQITDNLRWETGYLFHWVLRKTDTQYNHCLFFQVVLENPFRKE